MVSMSTGSAAALNEEDGDGGSAALTNEIIAQGTFPPPSDGSSHQALSQ